MIEAKFISAFLMGLMSSGHCIGMCGGIAAAFGMQSRLTNPQSLARLSAYNCGRILCYAALGGLFGYVGQSLLQLFPFLFIYLRVFAGLLLIAMACYVGRWWMGVQWVEQLGAPLWKMVQPLTLRFSPARHTHHALFAGMCWGLLPCGLVYSMLVWAGSQAHAATAALLMLCFGLGTLPSLFTASFAAGQLQAFLQKQLVRNISAALLLCYGVWTIAIVLLH